MINFFQGTKRNLVKSVSSMKNGDLAVATDEMRWYIKYNDVLEPLNSNLDQYEVSVEQTIERLEEAITYLENLTEGATDDVETATALATNMDNLINEAQSQLSVIEDVAQALNSIKIGGKNLLHNTKSFEQNDIVLTNGEIKEPGFVRLTSTVDNSSCFKYNVNYLNYSEYQNQVYTFSCDVRLAIAPTSFTEDSFRLLLGVNAENHENEIFSSSYDKYTYITLNNSLNTSWQRFSITASVPGGLSYGTSSALVAESNLTVEVEALNSTVPIEIRYPKLEKGNISTDWTPAPEDTSFEIGERNLLQKTESFTALNALVINGEIVEPGLARLTPTNHESYLKYNVDYLDYINYGEQNYTFSCDIRLADVETIYTDNEITLYIGVNSNENRTYIFDNSYDKYAFNVFTNDLSSNWKRFSITKNIPRDLAEGVNEALSQGSNITVQISAKENTAPIEIRHLKLERGTNVSDWTPAPEDLILSIKSVLNDLNSINETLDDHSRTITRIDSSLFSKAEAQDVALLTQTVTNISNIVNNLNNNYARIDNNGVIQGGTLDFSKVNGLERYFIRVNDSGVIDNNVTIDFSNVNGLNDHFAQIDENHMLVNAGVSHNNVVGLNDNYAQIIQVNGNNVLANTLVDSDDVLGLSENYAGIGPDGSLNSNVKIDSNNVTGLSENYAGIGPDGSLNNNVRIDFEQIDNLISQVALIENGFLQNAYIDSAQINDLYSNFAHVKNGYIENATIDYARIADLQAHYAEIENGYIKNAKIDYAKVDQLDTHYANIDFANITEAIIDTAHIKEAAIKSAQIDEAAIKSAHIDKAAIKSAHIDEAAIKSAHIDEAAIKSAHIDEAAIETAHIGNGVITSAKIGSGEIKEANIDNAAITTAKIEDAAIISAKIRQGAIENAHIQQAAIDTANIKEAAITTALIHDGAIVDSKIQNLSANKLTAGTINGDVINVTNLNAENLKVKRINGNPVLGGFEAVNKNIVDYENKNPTEESWYEFSNGNFVATVDTEVNVTKTYYKTNNNSVVTFYDKETVDTMFNAVDARIDSQIETFTGDEVPTLFNEPYTIWYQPEEDPPIDIRQEHVGDIYYVISSDPENPSDYDGWTYRFAWDNTQQIYKWVLIKDNQVTAALGEINQLDGSLSSFRTEVSSWKEETDDGLKSVWQSHNNLSGIVNKTVKSSIQLWYTKDNTTAPSEPTAIGQVYNTDDHSKWTTVVPTYNATYPYYYYCWQYQYVDNTYGWSTAVFDKATTESEERARTGIADAAAAQATADSNIKSTVQLWRVGSANTPLPSAPISHVTEDRANITNTWTKVVPVYNISNPYYFYCYEYQKGDNTYSWSDVIYDAATTENQANSRSALAQVETKVETSVFNSLENTVNENSATITSLSTKTETALARGIEYITGTQTSATNVWTGATQDETLHAGKTIAYKLPYAGNGTGVTLTLTLADGTTTTSPINVYINDTQVKEEYPANSVIKMTYDGHDWRIDNYNSDTNYYDREAYKASVTSSEAIAAGLIGVFNTNGTLKKLSNTAFDTSYPILYVGTAYTAANTTQSDNYTFWGTPFNLTNTHTIQGAAAGKPVYIVGSLNGNILTPNSTVLTCTIPTSEDNLFYLRLGLMSSTTEAVLESQHPIYAFFDGKFQQSNPAIVTTMTTTNQIRQTATSNNARITALITTIGTNEDGTPSKNPDENSMLYKVSDIEQNLDGFKTTVSSTYATKESVKGVNLSPFFSIPDQYEEETPDLSYWTNKNQGYYSSELGHIGTQLSDGWAHFDMDNSARSGSAFVNFHNVINQSIKPSTSYTYLTEVRNLTFTAGTNRKIYIRLATSNATTSRYDQWSGGNNTVSIEQDGEVRSHVTSLADFSSCLSETDGYFYIESGVACSFDMRISLYEGEAYDGPYKPYVDQTLSSRVKSAESAIIQNANNIELKVSESNVTGNYLIGKINLDSTTATISADRVNINGTAVFNSIKDTLDNTYSSTEAAVAEEQRIYYRSNSNTTPTSPGSTWITSTADIWNTSATVGVNGWSTKITPLANGVGGTKYIYLYTAIQKKTVSGAITTGTITLDDTTTIIDGGNIVTGSITANKLNAGDINSRGILTVTAFDSTTQNNILNNNIKIGGRNLLLETASTFSIPANGSFDVVLSEFAKNNIVSGDQLTISFDAWSTGDTYLDCYWRTSSSSLNNESDFYPIFSLTSTPTHFTTTDITATDLLNVLYLCFRTTANAHGDMSTGLAATITNLKLEHGNVATNWTEAPEDTNLSIEETTSRTQYDIPIKADLAITREHIICGNASGYHHITAGASFDLAYPILFAGDNVAQNTISANNYLQYPNITFTTSAAIQDAATNKIVYLKGKINSANIFTFDSGSNAVILTCTVPTDVDEYFYLPIGVLSNTTTGYFNSSNALYAYVKDNGFRQVTPSEIIEEQYIYISKASGTLSVNSNSTWVTENSDSQNTWTNTRPTYNTDYPVLFVAKQTKTISGAISCTTPKIDNTTTVIDGGHIITGSIDADKISVSDLKALRATIGGFTIEDTNIRNGKTSYNETTNDGVYLGTDGIGLGKGKFYVTTAGALTSTSGTIGGWTISSNSISHGTLGNSGGYILNASGNSSAYINNANRSNLALAIGSKFGVDKDGTLYANGANITNISIGNTDLEIGSTNLMLNTATLSTGSINGSGTFSTGTDSSVPSGQYCQFTSTAANTAGPHFGPSTTVTKLGMYNDKMIDGETYTFSAWVMTSANKTLTTVGPEESTSKTYSNRTLVANTWKRVSCTFKNYKAATYRSCPFYISEKLAVNEWIRISSLKLEKGNVATDWSEAPEDIATDISNAAKTATNYITQIGSTGINIHPASGGTLNYTNIDGTGLTIFRDSQNLAHFGYGLGTGKETETGSRIGRTDQAHIITSSAGYIQLNNGSGTTFAYLGNLAGPIMTSVLSEDAEVETAYPIPTDANMEQSIEVYLDEKDPSSATATSLTLGEDYTISNSSITLKSTSTRVQSIFENLTEKTTEEIYDEDTDTTEIIENISTIRPAQLEIVYHKQAGAGVSFGKAASQADFSTNLPVSFEYPDVVKAHHSTPSRNTGFYAKRDDTGISMFSGIGAGGINHGIWSNTLGKWIIYANRQTVHIPEHWVDGRMWISSYAMVQRSYWTTQGSAPSENSYGGFIGIGDDTGVTCYMEALRAYDDIVYNRLVCRRQLGSGNNAVFKSNILNLGVKSDGSCKVFIQGNGAVAAWRSALGVVAKAGDTITGTLTLSRRTDAEGTADNKPALIVGGTSSQSHLELDDNEIMAKADGTTVAALYINNNGGLVQFGDSIRSINRNMDNTATSLSNSQFRTYGVVDNNSKFLSYLQTAQRTDGSVDVILAARHSSDGTTNYDASITLQTMANHSRLIYFNSNMEARNVQYGIKATGLTHGTTPSSNTNSTRFVIYDNNTDEIASFNARFLTDGREGFEIRTSKQVSGITDRVYNSIGCWINQSGVRSYSLSDPSAFRDTLDINSSKSLSGTNAFTVNSNATLTAAYIRYSNVKVCTIYVKVKLKAKLAIGGTRTIGSIVAGYRPAFDFRLDFGGITGMTGYINSNGVITVGNGTGAEISANSEFYCTGTYVSA